MRKQVTFVEHIRKAEPKIYRAGTRSAAESKTMCEEDQKVSMAISRPVQKISDNHQLKKINIPKSMMTAPFLQHPALSTGQKRYIYSIANVYSTDHMRRQMKQHYINVLHRCIKSGQSYAGSRCTPRDHLCLIKMDADRTNGSKPEGARKTSSTTLHCKLVLPKIT